jgi:hypothetical protein
MEATFDLVVPAERLPGAESAGEAVCDGAVRSNAMKAAIPTIAAIAPDAAEIRRRRRARCVASSISRGGALTLTVS